MSGRAGRYQRSQLAAVCTLLAVVALLGALLVAPAEPGPDIEAGRGAPPPAAGGIERWRAGTAPPTTARTVARAADDSAVAWSAPPRRPTATSVPAAPAESTVFSPIPAPATAVATTTTAAPASPAGASSSTLSPVPTSASTSAPMPATASTAPVATAPPTGAPVTGAPATVATTATTASATAGPGTAATAAPAAPRATTVASTVTSTTSAVTSTTARPATAIAPAVVAPAAAAPLASPSTTVRPVPTTVAVAPAAAPSTTVRPAPTATTRAPSTTAAIVPEPVVPAPAPGPLDAACRNPVTVRPPAADLAAVVAAAAPGTCFRLLAGEYRFHDVVPKDGMTFLGASRAEVIVAGSATAENAFSGTARNVTIGRMTLRGFQGSAGQKRQQQAAIRGSAGIWRNGPGELASGWLIEDVESSGNYALGLLLGDRFTVRRSTFAGNGVAGIGGAATSGGLVQGNVVTGNGYQQLTGYEANGGGMKFTQATGPGEPLVIDRNEVHHNKGSGVWCDIGCTGFEVTGNYIHDQDSHGVVVELSSNAVIRDNLLVDTNTWTDFARDFNGGAITVAESSAVTVEGNYVDGARAGVVVRQTRRPLLPHEEFLYRYAGVNWVSGDVLVRGNVLVRTGATGISTGTSGAGMIGDPTSIRFEANTYGEAGSVAFWWDGGRRLDLPAWQAAGRDLDGAAAVPPRPVWTRLTS